MTLQQPLRSTTPSRLIDRGERQRNSSYDPYAPNTNQFYSQRFDPSASLIVANNILQRPGADIRQSLNLPKKNIHHGNYFFAPDSSENGVKKQNPVLNSQQLNESGHHYDRWNKIIQSQIEEEAKAIQEQKIQDRLRRQRLKYP